MFTPLIQYSVNQPPAEPLKLVTAVGCLVHGLNGSSALDHGSGAMPADQQGTSSTELGANRQIALGSEHYQLLGADVFRPLKFFGNRIVVKGIIPTANDPRINVTSMQPTAPRCPN